MDQRGKYISNKQEAEFFSSEYQVGIKSESGNIYSSDEEVQIRYIVLDTSDNLVDQASVKVILQKEKDYNTWIQVDECDGKFERLSGTQKCSFKPEGPGKFKIIAQTEDERGQISNSEMIIWIVGEKFIN